MVSKLDDSSIWLFINVFPVVIQIDICLNFVFENLLIIGIYSEVGLFKKHDDKVGNELYIEQWDDYESGPCGIWDLIYEQITAVDENQTDQIE